MANSYTSQIIKDTTKQTVIKLTGSFDGTGQEANNSRIQANTLYGALDANNNLLVSGNVALSYYGLTVYRAWYDCNINGSVKLYWSGDDTGNNAILNIRGNGEYNAAGNWIALQNPKIGSNVKGDIGIITTGAVANNTYTIILELHKDNNYYNAGQLNEPAAFNYGPYGVRP